MRTIVYLESKQGGQHAAPQIRRGPDLDMVLGDMDIAQIYARRDAARERQRKHEAMERQILDEIEAAVARRQRFRLMAAAAAAVALSALALWLRDWQIAVAAMAVWAGLIGGVYHGR